MMRKEMTPQEMVHAVHMRAVLDLAPEASITCNIEDGQPVFYIERSIVLKSSIDYITLDLEL